MILVSEIWEELKEFLGNCKEAQLYKYLYRGVQLLANKGLFDPLIADVDVAVPEGQQIVAMPFDLKTVLRININNTPSFSRGRLFEFQPNTRGSVLGPETSFEWHDRGYTPIHDRTALPINVRYESSDVVDNGKTITIRGIDDMGRPATETLTAGGGDGAVIWAQIDSVVREETTFYTSLFATTDGTLAEYQPGETVPQYRLLKFNGDALALRVHYRKAVFKLTAQTDIIPLHSQLAILHAAKAARLFIQDEFEKGEKNLVKAVEFITEEQASRDEAEKLASQMEAPTVTDTNINSLDSIIVADVYDVASSIIGPVGRQKLLDEISSAVEILGNKAHWDPKIGVVDIMASGDCDYIGHEKRTKGHGFFVLPRFVEAPVQINYEGCPTVPKNRWFEFHLNGPGERNHSACSSWEDVGEVVLNRVMPNDADGVLIPFKLIATPDSGTDIAVSMKIYGYEMVNGVEREVWRSGARGWTVPCVQNTDDPGATAPKWSRVERITKAVSTSFIRLFVTTGTNEATHTSTITSVIDAGNGRVSFYLNNAPTLYAIGSEVEIAGYRFRVYQTNAGALEVTPETDMYAELIAIINNEDDTTFLPTVKVYKVVYAVGDQVGFYYPDETEPKYRMIKIRHCSSKRIRVLYRRRGIKFTSVDEPIPLKSRMAVICMLRAMSLFGKGDTQAGLEMEQVAVNYLREERINLGGSESVSIQFDGEMGVKGYVM